MQKCRHFHALIQKAFSGELTPIEKELLDEHVTECPDCHALYTTHQKLQHLSIDTDPGLPDTVEFDRMRKNVLKKLIQPERTGFSLKGFFAHLLNPSSLHLAPIWGLALLLISFFLGLGMQKIVSSDSVPVANPLIGEIQQFARTSHSLADVDKSPYLLTNVRIRQSDTGDINVRFNLTTELEYTGDLQDPLVKEVITQALVNYTNDGGRLDAVALTRKMPDEKIIEALIFAMQQDENPAVRMKALEILGQHKLNDQALTAIIEVLKQEKLVHIRLQAMDILAESGGPVNHLEQIFKDLGARDLNPSVQIKAATCLQKIEGR